MIKRSGNTTVDALAFNYIKGFTVNPNWFNYVTKNGKTEALAVLVLAGIVYWYSPTFTKDNEIKKKFKADAYQFNYKEYADMFGMSKKTVARAIDLLCELGIIKKDIRNIKVGNKAVNNVVYVKINIEKLLEISGVRNEKSSRAKVEEKMKKKAQLSEKQKEMLEIIRNKKHNIPERMLKAIAGMLAAKNATEQYIDNMLERIAGKDINNYFTYIKTVLNKDYYNGKLNLQKISDRCNEVVKNLSLNERTYDYNALEMALLRRI